MAQPTSLVYSAYLTVTRFLAKAQNPQFRAFCIANHDKISRFYHSCKALAALLDEKNPEQREKLKMIYTQNYLATTDLKELSEMIDAEGNMELFVSESDQIAVNFSYAPFKDD